MAERNQFLLDLDCGMCGESIAGYTSTKIKPSGRRYRYRKYRCSGRVNRPGACTMPMLSADALEWAVLEAVFREAEQRASGQLLARIQYAIELRRGELLAALQGLERNLVEQQRRELERRRDTALDALLKDNQITDALRPAVIHRAEAAVKALQELEAKELTLRAGIAALESKARSVEKILTHPDLDPTRWEDPVVNLALQRALRIMVRRIEVSRQSEGRYSVKIWLVDPEDLLVSESVMSESTSDVLNTTRVRVKQWAA